MTKMHLTKAALRGIRDAFFPVRCYACGRLYRMASNHCPGHKTPERDHDLPRAMDQVLCESCARIEWIGSPQCTLCGRPFETRHGTDHLCADCEKQRFAFDSAKAVGVYGGALQQLIGYFKYQGHAHLALPLGRLMWGALIRHTAWPGIDRIVPVPLHWRRRRRRGFNQAELLMRFWPKWSRGCEFAPVGRQIAPKALTRTRSTPSQTGLGPKARRDNLRRAIKVAEHDQVRGCRVMLVDDVFTTGATADACARALKRSGTRSVHVFTLARAL